MNVVSLNDAIRAGLRKESFESVNAQSLYECQNLRPTPFGLRPHVTLNQPFTDAYITTTLSETKAWPYPQIFIGRGVSLLCYDDAIYTLTETGTTWTATPITTYDFTLWESTKAIPTSGGPWHFMDFFGTWMLFKNGATVFKTAYSTKTFVQTSVTIRTGLNFFDGRAMYGGFNGSDVYSMADWRTLLATYQGYGSDVIESYLTALSAGPTNNWVWWSTIGTGDLMWPFSLDIMTHGSPREVLYNTGFGSDSHWSVTGNWAVGSGKLNATAAITNTTQSYANQTNKLVVGTTYRVTFTISGYSAGGVRILLGSLGSSDYYTSNGLKTVDILCNDTGNPDFYIAANPSSAFTGSIDNISCTPLEDGYDADDPMWLDLLGRNESGFAPMPWQGDVSRILQLEDMAVVYGTTSATYKQGGIIGLQPVSLPTSATFGLRPIPGLGSGVCLAGRDAVGGGEHVHALIDEGGELWVITSDGAIRLGFSEFFSGMTGSDIVINFDNHRREFHISDGTDGYVLSKDGALSMSPQMPTTVHFSQGGLVGVLYDASEPDAVQISTTVIDSTVAGAPRGTILDVMAVEIVTTDIDTTGWTVYVDYRYKNSKTWTRSAGVSVDERGVARMSVSGVECRIVLTHPDRTKTSGIDALYVTTATDGKLATRHWLDASTPSAATV